MSILKVESIREPYNNTEAMFIDSSGDVTFSGSVVIPGTISGVNLATLNTTVSTLATDLTSLNSTVGNIVGLPDAIDVDASAPADSLNLDASGNVGIGTTSPDYKLDLIGSTNYQTIKLSLGTSANTTQRVGIGARDYAGTNTIGVVSLFSNSSGDTVTVGGGATKPDNITFETGNAERMRIDSSGDVGIGINTPSALLHVRSSTENIAIFERNGSSPALVRFNDNNTTNDPYIGSYGNDLAFGNYGSGEKMRILFGGGITFNGDTATANALDDYEEGTWTPVPRGSSSDPSGYTSNITGTYTKIGNKVWCNVNMTLNNDGSNGSGYFYINGFPFTPDDSQIFVVEGHNCERLMTDMRGQEIRPLITSNRVLYYYGSDNTAGMNALQWGTHVNTNLRFRVTFSYTI